jgi:hypothetical protein
MSEPVKERFPLNAPGDFYVENGYCIACHAPETEAPDLMAHTADGHCYFKHQPTTQSELTSAIGAVQVCCCGAVRYGGADRQIIEEIKRIEPNGCDYG